MFHVKVADSLAVNGYLVNFVGDEVVVASVSEKVNGRNEIAVLGLPYAFVDKLFFLQPFFALSYFFLSYLTADVDGIEGIDRVEKFFYKIVFVIFSAESPFGEAALIAGHWL